MNSATVSCYCCHLQSQIR